MTSLLGIASVLNPRYKLKIIEYFFPKLYGSNSSIEINNMKKLCYSLFEDYQIKTVGVVENSGAQLNDNESNTDGLNVSSLLTGFDLFVNDDTNESQSKSELDLYLEEKVLPRSAIFYILGWWKTNGIKYPTLQKIAKDILAIPISTVASESAFSTGGRLLSSHRSRLHQDTVEALMCAQSWLKHKKEVSIGITGPKQYIKTKDKRLQPVGESDSDDEITENPST